MYLYHIVYFSGTSNNVDAGSERTLSYQLPLLDFPGSASTSTTISPKTNNSPAITRSTRKKNANDNSFDANLLLSLHVLEWAIIIGTGMCVCYSYSGSSFLLVLYVLKKKEQIKEWNEMTPSNRRRAIKKKKEEKEQKVQDKKERKKRRKIKKEIAKRKARGEIVRELDFELE